MKEYYVDNLIVYICVHLLFMLTCLIAHCIFMDCLKLINAQQAKTAYAYKNMQEKFNRINATI
jgi:hypothetical protein